MVPEAYRVLEVHQTEAEQYELYLEAELSSDPPATWTVSRQDMNHLFAFVYAGMTA